VQPFDTNMRKVRSFICPDDGKRYFTTNKDDKTGRTIDTICNHCGRRLNGSCMIWEFIEHTEQETGACLKIHGCQHYEPVLTFQPPIEGLFGTFTTFRAGTTWVDRVMPGRTVSLYNTGTNKAVGIGLVDWVRSGTLGEMLEKYAHMNHSQKMNPEDAADRLRARLKRLYGPSIINDDKLVSVICMTELSVEQALKLRRDEFKRSDRRKVDGQ